MSGEVIFWVAFGLIWFWIALRAPTWALVARVRSHMLDGSPKDVRKLRTLLLIDGHRMPKKLRDALAVWLSEREDGS